MSVGTVSTVLPDAIYASLRSDILTQAIGPGATVTESSVALRFGVARPTAKMAIEKLVAEGLLRRERNSAARVPVLGRDDVIDLLDARAVVEGAAVLRLAEGGTIPADALAAHREMQAHPDDQPVVVALDIAFHRALVTGQDNQRLQRMHDLVMGEIELCIGQVLTGRMRTAAEASAEHQQILDALTAGDAALAEKLTHDHIAVTRERLLARLEQTT